jgi:hypothetical protein
MKDFPKNPSAGVTYYINGTGYQWNSISGWWLA